MFQWLLTCLCCGDKKTRMLNAMAEIDTSLGELRTQKLDHEKLIRAAQTELLENTDEPEFARQELVIELNQRQINVVRSSLHLLTEERSSLMASMNSRLTFTDMRASRSAKRWFYL